MTLPDNETFDRLLISALQGRAEPVPSIDIAGEALTRVRCMQANEARLSHLARWKRFVTIAAALLIGAVLAIGYMRFPESTTATADTTTVTTATTTIDLTTLGGLAAFIITLIAVVLMTLMTTDRPQLRMASA